MIIEKTAISRSKYNKKLLFFSSARSAFQQVLQALQSTEELTLLLPGYIGISPNEGSGIYDPVVAENIRHVFYHMDRTLCVDTVDFEMKLNSIEGPIAVLLVHYFGYPDQNIAQIVALCKSHNAFIIEDAAHALFTDYIDHACGDFGDVTLYSLHKMLPYRDGGMLKINNGCLPVDSLVQSIDTILSYDFYEISNKRKENAQHWEKLLRNHTQDITIIRHFNRHITPQSFPVVIHSYNRDDLYFKLNADGFGAVSLYHTMIAPIQEQENGDASWLSHRILNLPVHQDVELKQIDQMYQQMMNIMGGRSRS